MFYFSCIFLFSPRIEVGYDLEQYTSCILLIDFNARLHRERTNSKKPGVADSILKEVSWLLYK